MSTSLFNLKGKTALVTGGYKGLGFAMAASLGEAGAREVLNGRNQGAVTAARDELVANGIDAHMKQQGSGIGPGYFATDITAPIRVDGYPFNEFIINRTPTGRWGAPEELKGTAIFLASFASDFVNGQVVYVDGGILATIGKPSNEQ